MPATEMLRTVLPALDGAGIAAAVGGSGILAAPGLAGHVRDWESGGYFADRKPAAANRAADNANLAAELWDRSAQMCGLESSAAS